MTNLVATPGMTPVPELEITTVALGGPGGPMNAQAQALANQLALAFQQQENMLQNPMTAAGDVIVGGVAGVPVRLAASNGVLKAVNGVISWGEPSDGVSLSNTAAWLKNQYIEPVALAYASSVIADAGSSNNFSLTLTGDCTLQNPINLEPGMVLNFCVDQDGAGGHALTFGSLFKWPGGLVPPWNTGAAGKNFFSAYYDGVILRSNGGAGYS